MQVNATGQFSAVDAPALAVAAMPVSGHAGNAAERGA